MAKSIKNAFLILLLCSIFAGCESNNSFMTKSGIESKLQGRWDMVRIPHKQLGAIWEFDNGTLNIYSLDSANAIAAKDVGSYEVVAKIATPYIVIKQSPGLYAGGRWVIINIDDKYLTINRQDDGTFGTIQREFVKQ